MKKSFLRASGLALATGMMLTSFTGCGGSSTKAPEASATTATATAAATPAPVKLTVEVFDRGATGQTPPIDNYWTKWIKEKVKKDQNLDVEFVAVPRSQEVDKLNVLMAANQAPDISFTYDVNVIYNYVKNGGLTDLTPFMDKQGKELKAFLGDDVLKMGQYSNKQMAIPAKRMALAKFATYVRKDWVDKLGMKMPTTTDEFYTLLKAFKEKNPGGVSGVVPFSMTFDVEWTASLFFEAFKTKATEEEQYVNAPFLVPGYKDGARFLNKLFNEGLISPEFALDRESKKSQADLSRGLAGSVMGNYDDPLRVSPGIANQLKKNVPGAQLVPVDTLTNAEGKHAKSMYDPAGLRMIVPKSSAAKAEAAVRYLGWLTQKDNLYFLQNGEQGVHHDLQDGIPVIKTVDGEKRMNTTYNLDYTLIVNGIELGDKEKNVKAMAKAYPGFETEYVTAYNLSTKDGYLPPSLPVPVDAEAKYGKTLKEKSYEMYAKMVTAKPADFDKTWDSAIAEWLKIGGQEVIDQRKAAWKDAHK